MSILIGFDIGTTKLCAVALDASTGALIAVEDALNDTQLPGDSDAAEQDAAVILDTCHALLKRLCARLDVSDVIGIGVTGQMHGVVVSDKDGKPTTPLVTWQDGRGTRQYRSTDRTYVEELAHRLGDEGRENCGCSHATGFGAVTLLRMREEGTLPESGVALTIHDLLVRSLCGASVTDPTDAASWGIFDVRDATRWLPPAADALQLPPGMLPEVVATGSVAGGLLPETARGLALLSGVPITVALGDNQASFIGSVPSMRDTCLLNLGTGGQMSVPIDRFARTQSLDTRPLVAGQWLLVGASLCGGRAYQILEQFFADVGKELFGIEPSARLYDRINQLAAQSDEDCGGLSALTRFEGTRSSPLMRGSVGGIGSSNFKPGNLSRAIIAGMVGELVYFLDKAMESGSDPRLYAGSGNAVRRNAIVRAEIERQVGMPLSMPPHPEEAAIGAALTVGVAVGVYKHWDDAGRALFGSLPPQL
jgi:sugar (pentulose or hexulose) kinase